MERKRPISQYRKRLDKTLSSAELTDSVMLKTLVKNQILRYAHDEKEEFSEDLLDKRAQEVSNFLDMLRSTSIDDHQASKSCETSHSEWKLKHDNEEFRVMYHEGPHGSPFHTLLVEGYVDGPLDVYVSLGSRPSTRNERVKVAWPLSAREALVHYFFFEYFKDDLIVVLVNTISDVSSIDKATHGFTNDGIPEAKDVVRIDMVGGFALQKVNNERSYFRTIANVDMKLDFVPPSLINFISRQLVGNGFRLYQKTVASVSKCDEDYSKALGDPLFALICEALYSGNKSGEVLEVQEPKSEDHLLPNENLVECTFDNTRDQERKVHANDHTGESTPKKAEDTKRKAFVEIEEEESEESTCLENGVKAATQPSTDKFANTNGLNANKRILIRPEVEEALGTLAKAISILRQYGRNARSRSSSFSNEEPPNLEEGIVKDSTYAAEGNACLRVEVGLEATSKKFPENLKMTSDDSRPVGSSSLPREVNHNKVAPESPQQNVSIPIQIETNHNQVALNSYGNGTIIKANGFHENGLNDDVKKLSNWRKRWSCCFAFPQPHKNTSIC